MTPVKQRRSSRAEDGQEEDDEYMMNHTAIVKLKASLEESRAPVRAKVENPNNLIVESVSEDGRTDVMSDVRDEPGIVATPYENNTQD